MTTCPIVAAAIAATANIPKNAFLFYGTNAP